jgi:bla regulator protein BlaR1
MMLKLLGDHIWQSTVFAAAAGVLTLAFRRNRASVRHWIWFTASVKFLIPFGVLAAVGRLFASSSNPILPPARISHAFSAASQPFSQAGFLLSLPSLSPAATNVSTASPFLAVIWLAGFVVLLLAWSLRWRRVASVVREASDVTDGPELEMLRQLEQRTRLKKTVRLVSSNTSLEPGVFGIFRPVLLWPNTISLRLGSRQVEAILAHEVSHVHRRDNLLASIHMIVEAIFWFHPLVWWMGARLVDERERACDEEVIRLGSKPQVYAESILKTCEFSVESPLACVSGVTGSDLKKRIEAIMTTDGGEALRFWKKFLLAAVAVAVPIAIGVVNAPRLEAQQPAQADATSPAFDVASIKSNKAGDGQMMMQIQPGGRMNLSNVTLRLMIRNASRIQEFQIVGGPDWLALDRFDITAKAEGNPSADQMRLMFQKLLEERFKLKTHHETRELPVYSLVMARSDGTKGAQLRPSQVDCSAFRGSGPPPGPGQAPPQCGFRIGPGTINAQGVTMAALVSTLSMRLNRVVLDRTGLSGNFDIDLTWTPDQNQMPQGAPPPGAPDLPPIDPNGPSIFTAVQEQLGLKLESTKGPVEVLVIDHVERPTEN